MTRMFRHQTTQRAVAGDSDELLCWCPIPEAGVLNNVWLDVQAIGPAVDALTCVPVGIAGYLAKVPDPTNAISVDALWDAVVPKDTIGGPGTLDGEVIDADTNPEWEIGVSDPTEIFDSNEELVELFKRRELLTAARSHIVSSVTPAFLPVMEFKAKVSRRLRVANRSMAMFALSLPGGASTTITIDVTPSRVEWDVLRYIEVALEAAFVEALNLLEAALDDPFTTLADLLADFLEPIVTEDTAGKFANATFDVFTMATFDITVPGKLEVGPLTGG